MESIMELEFEDDVRAQLEKYWNHFKIEDKLKNMVKNMMK